MSGIGHPTRTVAVSLSLVVALTLASTAQQRDRSQIDEKYTWNLSEIYPSDAAWRQAKDRLAASLPGLEAYKGTLGQSPSRLADALDELYGLAKELSRTFVYASMMSDQDTRVAEYQGMKQEMLQLASNFSAAAAFLEPEILAVGQTKVDEFVAAEPRLAVHHQYLDDILRRRDHTLSDAEERLLASAGLVASAPSTIFNIFANADFPYPEVTLGDGKTVRLDAAGFGFYRTVPNRADREKVMSAFFGALGQYRGAFELGMHKGQYRALVQRKPVAVYRDANRDDRLDLTGDPEWGMYGINIHRASATKTSEEVDKWSAGCQVFQDPKHFDDFMRLVENAAQVWGPRFTYTLLEG